MEYSEHRFRRIVAEETKPLEQMASYIHQNADMKLYLLLTLEDYAEFEAIQKHYYGRIQWVVNGEAYSAAGKTWFGWWLVEHYLPYHVNCPDGCGLGEPTRGRKDPPYFQMGYGSFDHIADLVDPFVESPLPA